MNKGDLLNLWGIFTLLQSVKANVKFSYAVAKNRVKIKPEVEAIQEAMKPSDEYLKFEQERFALLQEYGDKDEKGRIKMENGNVHITEKLDEFNEKLDALKKTHADAITANEDHLKEVDTLLAEDFKFDPFQVSLEMFPDEIEPNVVEAFMNCNLIKDE